METEIQFFGEINEIDSYALSELSVLIENECDVHVQQKRTTSQHGVKDGGLVIALTIAGLAFSAVSTLITVISYWETKQQSKKLKYSIAILIGNKIFKIENLQPEQIQAELELAKLQEYEQGIRIEISHK
jgi:hypothetical protein